MSEDRYAAYTRLKFDRPEPRVLRVTFASPLKLGAMDAQMHAEIATVWKDIALDEATAAVLLTGDARTFSAGGDKSHEVRVLDDFGARMQSMREARDLVYNMTDCPQPIVSAARGWAVGAGLACLILADVSIMSQDAKLTDGHVNIGVAAGDHATIIWPLLCGMARAKYYLLTGERMTGADAARIGLITMALPDEQVPGRALAIATQLANGAPAATRWTKQTLNHWLRRAGPIFDTSLGLEFIGFSGPEAREGVHAMLEKRKPRFDPNGTV
jgi:enoyl-CoA hydratase/carnithine racemase